jgi:hypothetical protein
MLQSSSWPPANLAVTKRMCRGTGIEPFAVPQEHVVDPGICASTGATSKSSTEPSRQSEFDPKTLVDVTLLPLVPRSARAASNKLYLRNTAPTVSYTRHMGGAAPDARAVRSTQGCRDASGGRSRQALRARADQVIE